MLEPQSSLESVDTVAARLAPLGTPRAEFSYRGRWLVLLAVVLGAHLAGILLWGGRGLWFFDAVAALFGVREVVWAYLHRRWKFLVLPEGLVQLRPEGMTAFFWEEIETFEQRIRGADQGKIVGLWRTLLCYLVKGASLWYIVRRFDGTEITFDYYLPKLKKLRDLIEEETLDGLYVQARAVVQAGGTVFFGPVGVSRTGLWSGYRTLTWDKVKTIVVNYRKVLIRRKVAWPPWLSASREWYNGSVWKFSNLHIFQALTDSILASRCRAADARKNGRTVAKEMSVSVD
jgi:hypothetical protein